MRSGGSRKCPCRAGQFEVKVWSGANLFELHKANFGRDDNSGMDEVFVSGFSGFQHLRKKGVCEPSGRESPPEGKYFIALVPFASTEDLESLAKAALIS